MDFNPPDPEKILKSIERLKDVFNDAAANSTGAGRPLFKKLSENFNAMIDASMKADPSNLMGYLTTVGPAMMNLRNTQAQIDRLAQTDPNVAKTNEQLKKAMQKEGEALLGGLDLGSMLGGLGGKGGLSDLLNGLGGGKAGGLGGLLDGLLGGGKGEQETPDQNPPSLPKPPRPKPPKKKDDFDL